MSEFLNPQEITALSRAMLRSRWDEARALDAAIDAAINAKEQPNG